MQNCKNLVCLLAVMMCAYTGFAQSAKGVKKTPPAQTKEPAAKPAPNTAAVVTNITAIVEKPVNPYVGRYELYSGIPSMYLGHFILLANGKYKIAFDTAETDYDETGVYIFHSDTNTIEWVSGMFKNNNWGGKIEKTDKGVQIRFNKATYGTSNK